MTAPQASRSISRGELNRPCENTSFGRDSLMRLAQIDGLLHSHIKKEVETALQREGCKLVVDIAKENDRSKVRCDLLKKKKTGEDLFLSSDWCSKEEEAVHKVFHSAALHYNLLDNQGILRSRTWCSGVLNTLLSKYFKEKAPTVSTHQNDPQNPNVGYFCELYHEGLARHIGESDFPKVRGNSFKRKKDAQQDAALQALKTWKYNNAMEAHGGTSTTDESDADTDGTTSSSDF